MDKLLGAYMYLAARAAEPSTHAALSSMFAMAGLSMETGVLHNVLVIISLGFGASGFWIKEAKPQTEL